MLSPLDFLVGLLAAHDYLSFVYVGGALLLILCVHLLSSLLATTSGQD